MAMNHATSWNPDEPVPQSYYAFNHHKQKWEPRTATTEEQQQEQDDEDDEDKRHNPSRLALFSWNIDFMLPFAKARMDVALETLQKVTGQSASATTAVIIFLQECVESDLATIAEKPWVRDRFLLTDLDSSHWAGSYGTTTLVDRRLPLVSLFRAHYAKTRMQRDALFADVLMMPGGGGGEGKGKGKKRVKDGRFLLRLCNTHLESLNLMPPYRPAQMRLVAHYLKEKKKEEGGGVAKKGSMAAGDFNAIQDFDRTLHADNGLRDAYLETGGQEDSPEGYTWGQQAKTALRERYGCSRMDKVYYYFDDGGDGDGVGGGGGGGAGEALRLLRFETFGAGVELDTAHEEQRMHLVRMGFERPWITDHLGVMAEFEIAHA